MSLLDRQRNALEEYETLGYQISERIRKNPNLTVPTPNKRPRKEEIVQQHEMRFMAEKMTSQAENYLRSDPTKTKYEIELLNDPDCTFKGVIAAVQNTKDQFSGIRFVDDLSGEYAMYSSATNYLERGEKARVQRKQILSKICAPYIDVDLKFSATELWGTILDLYPFYQQDHDVDGQSYVQYLNSLTAISHSDEHKTIAILQYLIDFWKRSHPLENVDLMLIKVNSEQAGSSEANGQIWCGPCQKWFKETVYNNHLNGKKHKKAAKKTIDDEKPKATNEKLISWILENPLKSEFEATKTAAGRPRTDRERMLELSHLTGDDSDYTDIDPSDDDNDSDADNNDLLGNLPIGPNGKPIPHWLYKLQGLNKRFYCEICGNVAYQGKIMFERHFTQSKHQYGLKCLGVCEDQVSYFNSITSIKEAQALLERLANNNDKGGFEEEVEDSEGNVMSKSDYEELKQQGLL